jgi:hypothetical protein
MLTLGPNVIIDHSSAGALASLTDRRVGFADGIVNEGKINASAASGTLTINPTSFTNQGTINVSNGDTVGINASSWSNAGLLNVSGGSLNLGGTFTLSPLGTISHTGGTINITGTLNNTGMTLNVGTGTGAGALTMLGGDITGGTIADAGSGIVFTTSGGTLTGVTYDGTLDVSGGSANVSIVGSLTAKKTAGTGSGTINDTGLGSVIYFDDTQTFNNATINIGNSSGNSYLYEYDTTGTGGTLTLGPNVIIDHSGTGTLATITDRRAGFADGILNKGTINAHAKNGTLNIDPTSFTNQGTINVSNGDTVSLQFATSFTNLSGTTLTGGLYIIGANSTLQLSSSATIATLNADLTLSGANSAVLGASSIDASLTAIGAAGALRLLAGRNFTTTQSITNSGTLQLGGGTFQAASLTDNAGSTLLGFGTITGTTFANSGLIEANGGLLKLKSALTGTGGLQIDGGATLEIGSTLNSAAAVNFNGANATITIDHPGSFGNTIGSLAVDDVITLVGVTGNQVVLNGSNQLVVSNSGTTVDTIQLAGNNAGFTFKTVAGGGGTEIVVNAVSVSIGGTAQQGQTLTANVVNNDPDASIASYQWQSLIGGNWTSIAGATGSTYVVQESDETNQLRFQVITADSDGGSATAVSAATSAVSDIPPTAPVISGIAQEGQSLTATAATINDSDATGITYQWQKSFNGGTTWSNIGGATSLGYVVQESDEGAILRIVATSVDADGNGASTASAATSAVTDIAPTLTTPVISGTAEEGQTLTATAAVPNEGEATVAYQWRESFNGGTTWSNIAGATSLTYVVQESDEGAILEIVATSSDTDGSGTTATSAVTAGVIDISPTLTTPTISGTAQEGQTLTATAAMPNDGDATVAYQWQESFNGGTTWSNITGATSLTYAVQQADEGAILRIVATSSDTDGGGTTSTSSLTSTVTDIPPTLSVTITGKALDGQTLKAVPVANDADAVITYQWQIFSGGKWTNIAGATGKTLAVTEADEGQKLRVTVTSSDADSGGTSATSAPTKVVTDAAPTVTIAKNALSVSAGGTVGIGIGVSSPDTDDVVSVTIGGIASYEFITATDGTTSTGSSFTFTAAEVNAGLTLHSTFGGTGNPTNTLTIAATDTEAGVTVSSKTQKITVTDPPAGNSSMALLTQFMAAEFSGDSAGLDNTWAPAHAGADPALSTPTH